MADQKKRLGAVARELNVGKETIVQKLKDKGFDIKNSPNTRLSSEQYAILEKMYASSKADKEEAADISIGSKVQNTVISARKSGEQTSEEEKAEANKEATTPSSEEKQTSAAESNSSEEAKTAEPEKYRAIHKPKVLGKIDLDASKKSTPKKEDKVTPPSDQAKKEAAPKTEAATPKQEPKVEKTTPPAPEKPKTEAPKTETKTQQSQPKEATKETNLGSQKSSEPSSSATPKKENAAKETPKVEAKKTQTPKEATSSSESSTPKREKTEESTKSTVKQDDPKTEPKKSEATSKASEEVNKQSSAKEKEENVTVQEDDTKLETIEAKADKLQGLKVVGKIELPDTRRRKAKPVASSDASPKKDRKKKRRTKDGSDQPTGQRRQQGGDQQKSNDNRGGGNRQDNRGGGNRPDNRGGGNRPDNRGGGNRPDNRGGGARPDNRGGGARPDNRGGGNQGNQGNQQQGGGRGNDNRGKGKRKEVSAKDVKQGMKSTMARMSGGRGGNQRGAKRSKYKKDKRSQLAEQQAAAMEREMKEASILRVTEFISANELATLMNVGVNDIIASCMGLGMFISINQRLDEEQIQLIAEEFNFEVVFTSAEEEFDVELEEKDKEEDLQTRAPIVTIMGHVDHGKTSLLDYIRNANVADGEAGGITQHIGAYDVTTQSGKRIAFLDTPGHEAFTAMRARGAKLTDVAIIVIAADDNVMPQTVEAINHAQVAGVPIVFAINKIDKPGANSNKIKEELSQMNILVEDWGGKYQCYEISAKKGLGIEDLLEGVSLEAEMLELKANPEKKAVGTVVEASLDKGRGYVATMLVQAGTLSVGDVMLAGAYYGKVKAMTDHRGKRLKKVGPSTPVQVLGLNGAPQAGDKLNIMDTDREAREIATKREQILRAQSIKTTQRTTLDMIGKRIAQGSFQQLNLIIKGDVDGSVEALSDSLLKLSTDEVEVRIIHKAVGAISESDVMLAAADTETATTMIGFQVRPTPNARKLAEKEGIEIRTYSVIYDAINDVKAAMEGMLAPEIEEVVVGNVEIREVFKISKIGTIAGCFVTDGYIKRNSKIRLIREGIVIYGGENGGEINALKRFKDDVSEVKKGYECGLSLTNYNDIKIGDVIEVFEEREVKRTLADSKKS
ncbi:translation initiation factor IF-2 [Sediminitomix flava]|uniref:Translation initiation factor IF-2 n=1 Tax=Sediminitomix flava TaxID=379075 RepID=A0A316A4G0_SEDFL|nr:translation initiation factor IF-2 [Sediminitomix flava]PWJ44627.1 translation initiation factor 2 (bIF-2) [Sediminitomix flava]